MNQNQTPPQALDAQIAAGLLGRRIILLDRALEDENVSTICSQLLLLSQEDAAADIILAINSPGGSVPGMLAIADLMELIPNDVRTLALGMAYSAGQFLLSAGTPGKRFALPHATVLLHQGSAGFGGSAVDIALQAQHLRTTRDTVLGIIARHTGQPLERVTADSQRDRIWDASGALEYGFIDEVVHDVAAVLNTKRKVGLAGSSATAAGQGNVR